MVARCQPQRHLTSRLNRSILEELKASSGFDKLEEPAVPALASDSVASDESEEES